MRIFVAIIVLFFIAPAVYGILTHSPQKSDIAPVAEPAQASPIEAETTISTDAVPYKLRIIDPERPTIASVAQNPKSFIGKTIAFRRAYCVNDPKAGFLCRISTSGRTLRIEAGGLGISGGDIVGERLIGPCKGKDKIGKQICRFDIIIEPRSAQSEAVMEEFEGERVTRLYSGLIEMTVPRKK